MTTIEQAKNIFERYIPSERDGVALIMLHQRIENGSIDSYFTNQDIRQILQEVTGNVSPNVDDFLQRMFGNFIERPLRRREGKYALTDHSRELVTLIFTRVDSARKKFSLSNSVEQYATIDTEKIRSLLELESWHQQSFDGAARRTINDHIAGLNDQLKGTLSELSTILKNDEQTLGQKIDDFVEVFHQAGTKAYDIQRTLGIRQELSQQLQVVLDLLYSQIKVSPLNIQNDLKEDYRKAQTIVTNIEAYFDDIENRIDFIIDKIIYAEEKLTELQTNFQEHARLRINIKRLLNHCLDHSQFDKKNGVTFIFPFRQKSIVYQPVRFIDIQKYDFDIQVLRESFIPTISPSYFEAENTAMSQLLGKQEGIDGYVNVLLEELNHVDHLDLSRKFWEVYEAAANIEVPLIMCTSVISELSKSNTFSIEVVREPQFSSDKTIAIWKMTIQRNDPATTIS
jgi:hypothetical protein